MYHRWYKYHEMKTDAIEYEKDNFRTPWATKRINFVAKHFFFKFLTQKTFCEFFCEACILIPRISRPNNNLNLKILDLSPLSLSLYSSSSNILTCSGLEKMDPLMTPPSNQKSSVFRPIFRQKSHSF